MAITAIRKTVLETINEVRIKLNTNTVTTLTADSFQNALLQYLNDVITFLSDQGDWLEQIQRVQVTAVTSVDTYSIVGSATVVKNIHDMYFGTQLEMRNVGYDQLRRNTLLANATGQPTQYALIDTDENGNPQFQVYPNVSPAAAGTVFNITVFVKPPLYTTADATVLIPFDSRLVTKGLLALALLDESTGAPTNHYQVLAQTFADENFQVYARFRGNTGNEFRLTSMRQRSRRR